MPDPITVYVPSIPVAQPRPRVFNIGGRARAVSAPAKHPVNAFKSSCAIAWRNAHPGPPLHGAIHLRLSFVMPRPKNRIWKSRPMPREPYVACKNDWDNLGKSVCDALNGLAWRDDGQICRVEVERWIAAGDEQPHVTIGVTPIET